MTIVMASSTRENASRGQVCGVFVMEWLAKLSDKHRWVIERRFGLNNQEMATLEELAKDLKVTRERVRQIQVEAQKELAIGLREKGVFKENWLP